MSLFPRIMHDEVSETENIRKNLAIERMIVEGCEILLDTSQTFVRQGNSCLSEGGISCPSLPLWKPDVQPSIGRKYSVLKKLPISLSLENNMYSSWGEPLISKCN